MEHGERTVIQLWLDPRDLPSRDRVKIRVFGRGLSDQSIDVFIRASLLRRPGLRDGDVDVTCDLCMFAPLRVLIIGQGLLAPWDRAWCDRPLREAALRSRSSDRELLR